MTGKVPEEAIPKTENFVMDVCEYYLMVIEWI